MLIDCCFFVQLTVPDHLSVVSSFKPDIFEPLCDTAAASENKSKRIKKSVDRTLSFLDQTLEIKSDDDNVSEYILVCVSYSSAHLTRLAMNIVVPSISYVVPVAIGIISFKCVWGH